MWKANYEIERNAFIINLILVKIYIFKLNSTCNTTDYVISGYNFKLLRWKKNNA